MKDESPKHKDEVISTRVPADVKRKAIERAKKNKREISEIIRSWLHLFSEKEAPLPPVIEDERAPNAQASAKEKQTSASKSDV